MLVAVGVGVVACGLYFGRTFARQMAASGQALVQETLQKRVNQTCAVILSAADNPVVESITEGKVRQISVNSTYMNRLAAECNTQCEQDLSAFDKLTVSVPRGALTGSQYLADKGRQVTYTLSVSYDLATRYKTTVEAVGINQVRFAVYLVVQATAHVTVPLTIQDVQYTYYVPVCETLYAADVPNVYVADENGTNYLDLLP